LVVRGTAQLPLVSRYHASVVMRTSHPCSLLPILLLLLVSVVALLLLALCSASAPVNLITDGGFESGDFCGWSVEYTDVDTTVQPFQRTQASSARRWAPPPSSSSGGVRRGRPALHPDLYLAIYGTSEPSNSFTVYAG
jgi:hypothetical protein